MKIISLDGENLASLAAPFHIDFASGILADAGLFAICGNTGAGKSTILDAICLSLFDAMPRFSSNARGAAIGHADSVEKERLKSNDVRHILTRGAANGFAQITFEIDSKKRYQARWSVKRARNSAQGRFQAQEMQLIDCQTDQVLATKKTEVLNLIESLIGLNYEQFKRSVLLAQGDFAAFLKAPAKERSELLERITGTQLYSQLSKKAFEKAKEQEQSLLLLKSKVGEVQLLSQDQQHQLANELAELNESISDINTQHKLLTWLDERLIQQQQLIATLSENKTSLLDAMAAIEQQDSINQILDKIERAQGARVVYARHHQQQKDQMQQSSVLKDLQQQVNDEKTSFDQVHQQTEQLAQLKSQAQLSYETKLPDLELAITKTIELESLKEQLITIEQQLSLLEQQRLANQHKLKKNDEQLSKVTVEHDNAQHYLATHRHIEPLVNQLNIIDQHIHEFGQAKKHCKQYEEKQQQSQQQAIDIELQITKLSETLTQQQQHHQHLQQQLWDYAQLFKNENLQSLESELSTTQAEHLALSNEQQVIIQGLQYQAMMGQKSAQQQELDVELSQLRQSYRQCKQQLDVHIPLCDEAEKALNLAKEVMSLSAHRHQLVDGQPCALCGSEDHPYSRENAVGDELINQLSHRYQQLESQSKHFQQQLTKYDVLGKQKSEQLQQLVHENNELTQLIKALNTQEISLLRQGEVEHQLAKTINAIEQTKAKIQQVSAHINDAKILEQQGLEAGHNILSSEQAIANLVQQRNQLASDLSLSSQSLMQYQQQQQGRIEALTAIYDRIQWQDILNVDIELAAFKRELMTDVEGFVKTQTDQVSLANQLNQLKQQIIVFKEQQVQYNAQCAPIKAQYEQDNKRVITQQNALFQLTDGESPQVLKQQLETHINELSQAHQNANENLTTLHNRLLVTQSKLTQAQERIAQLSELAQTINSEWLAWQNELAIKESALIELLNYEQSWIVEQRQVQAKLLQESHQAQAIVAQQQQQVAQLETQLVERTVELVQAFPALGPAPESSTSQQRSMLLAGVDAQLTQLTQQQFEYRSKLEQHNQGMIRFGQLQTQIDEQQEVTSLWLNMKDLIGSADGAKFRTFAQSLTLEQMLIGANHHLLELAPRYSLQRVPGVELELQMIDKNMGDEVRSIDSLSGGETFLVSLALALGLGSLTSLQTTIRSLFIDEGFGTLDPDTLEVALSCLDSLQASGRQIGIISHVQGLVERVGTRIQINASGDGHSTIKLLMR